MKIYRQLFVEISLIDTFSCTQHPPSSKLQRFTEHERIMSPRSPHPRTGCFMSAACLHLSPVPNHRYLSTGCSHLDWTSTVAIYGRRTPYSELAWIGTTPCSDGASKALNTALSSVGLHTTRVHGPCSRATSTARKHGPFTRVVVIEF